MSTHSNELPDLTVRTERGRPTTAVEPHCEETLFQTLLRLATDWVR
jgi:hypothetical protein